MYCQRCGRYMDQTDSFCRACGAANPSAGMVAPVTPAVDPEMEQMAQGILTRGIVGLALSELPVAGIVVSKKAKNLHDEYIARGGVNAGKAKVGRILANVAFPVSIVGTVLWAWMLLVWFIWFLVICGLLGAEFAGYL